MLWRPEYGRFMIEGTPGQPYAGSISDFLTVESNMRLRRETVQALLRPNEVALTVTNFPLLGTPNFTEPPAAPRGPAARSLFFPDEAINAHRRFPTLTQNIRERRGKRVAINMPVFRDVNTPKPFAPKYDDEEADAAALPEHIYMDAMGFGMGCCCLQVTFQACSIDEARHLYDQLAVIAPVMLALTAATPIFRGYLADVDCRWNTISQSVDDRTQEEQGKAPLKSSRFVIPKSRYDSIDSYISQDPALRASHNDIPLVMDHGHYATLRNGGVDHLLAQHVAHLFIRDPLVVYRERLNQDDENESDHFENIQSTNWQTMRFKPPPPNSSIGWRVEFRVMEVQLTDFENAAFTLFIVLLTRAILSFDLLFYIPISKVDENMQTAQKRDAVSSGKFFFRKNLTRAVDDDSYELMDVNTIINGQEGAFPGLLPLLNQYLDSMEIDFQSRSLLASYFELISKRASGELITTAKWMREFVQQHPEYKKDSVVSGPIAFDLVKLCADLGNGIATAERLLGPLPTQPAQ
ncbi:glutamate-cysteine ligase, variant [Capsaspora owczarzaki ATCC 30864]|nr:glutamate-cysteine ligase, variant [Capsaspora owczarzaki ATCC 30864]